MARARRLGRSFYDRDAGEVAPDLLGKVLAFDDPHAGRLRARLVEVEAYRGADDPGSHSFRGRTARNATMFGRPGLLYVYFTYGMHWCANAVCGPGATPHAVLLRAAVPLTGTEAMRARRPAAKRDRALLSGPANLARAFGLDGTHDGTDLTRGPLRILDDGEHRGDVAITRRVGLAPGKGDELLLRFVIPRSG